jgi:hypothetical protein
MLLKNRPSLLGYVAAVAFTCGAAHAGTVQTFSGSSGDHSATASFEFIGNQLHITLTNTMTSIDNPSWLTGLFFDIAGSPTINSGSADADLEYLGIFGWQDYNSHTASQMWAFDDNIGAGELPFGDQQYGLGAAGYDVFGPGDMLAPGGPGSQPNGIGGGILPDIAGLFVPPGHWYKPFAIGSVHFVLNLPNGFGEAGISNVVFAFGSGFDEIYFPASGVVVPLPAALPMGLAGLAGLLVIRRRRKARIA